VARILLIEDHQDIAALVGEYLEARDNVVDYAADGVLGLHLAVTESFDLIVLDLMLPGIDGLTICQRLRDDAQISTPILMLTARDTLEDKIAGLDAGADDYLVKPFDVAELEARVRALLRRSTGTVSAELLELADLVLDLGTMTARRAYQELTLTPIGIRILKTLLQASPNVVARRDLEKAVWEDVLPDSDALRSHLYNLRKVVDKPFDTPLIHNVTGVGYRMAYLAGDA
jgi:DNA-binding response OmpR family regulator